MLEQLEAAEADPTGPLAYLAGLEVSIDEDELKASRRRAMLLLAAGGDPRRDLFLDDRAVGSLADDLDDPGRGAALEEALRALADDAAGLPRVSARLAELRAEPEVAWRWYALALLADELGSDEM